MGEAMAAMISRSPRYLHGAVKLEGCALLVCDAARRVFVDSR